MAGKASPDAKSETQDILVDPDAVKLAAAKLYAGGLPRAKIARVMVNYLVPNGRHRPLEQRLSQARNKLRNWEEQEKFRDLVWNNGLRELDLATPRILKGVAKKAAQGRVDAARLALEVTGRHNPKGDASPATVVIAFDGIPRPRLEAKAVSAETIEGEVIRELEG